MKGIILAGGSGTRLYPLTISVNKQLLPVYDKPLIYYPLSTLVAAGISDILIITAPTYIHDYYKVLADGSQWGIHISYAVQPAPNGIAQAFVLGERFIGTDAVTLILGDNIFHGSSVRTSLRHGLDNLPNASIFGYVVSDPGRYGVVEFDEIGKVINIEEKPKEPKSNVAVTGLYVYPNEVIEIAKNLQPSARGEYEITDINKEFLTNNKLRLELLDRGTAWLDTGTPEAMMQAAEYVYTLEQRTGLKIGCIEEVAVLEDYMNYHQLEKYISQLNPESSYTQYLRKLMVEYFL